MLDFIDGAVTGILYGSIITACWTYMLTVLAPQVLQKRKPDVEQNSDEN